MTLSQPRNDSTPAGSFGRKFLPLALAAALAVALGQTGAQRAKLKEVKRLHEEAMKLARQGNLKKAIATFEEKLALERQVWAPASLELVGTLEVLARGHEFGEDFAAALKVRREVVRITEKVRGKGHWQVTDARRALADTERRAALDRPQRVRLMEAEDLIRQASVLRGRGKYEAAVPLARQSLALRKEILGEKHPDYAHGLHNLAELYRAVGDYDKALPLQERARAIYRAALGEKHPDYAGSLHNLAVLYRTLGAYAQALPLHEQARAIYREALGEKHPLHANSLSGLATLYKTMGSYAQALPLLEQARAIFREALGTRHFRYATSLNNLADLYQVLGAYDRALPLLEQARAIYREALGEKHPYYANSLNSLASLYRVMGNYARALPLCEQARAIYRAALGDKHPYYASSLHTLARLYVAMGNYPQALPLYEQALAIDRQTLGEKHPRYAGSLSNLAHVYQALGAYEKALPLFERARDIRRQALGEKHPDHALSLNNLAMLYRVRGAYSQAIPLCERARDIYRQALGDKHPSHAATLNNLAALYQETGAPDKALPLLERARDVRRQALGTGHPDYAESLTNLAVLHAAGRRWGPALRAQDEASRCLRRLVNQALPALSEVEQLNFLRSRHEPSWHGGLSLGLLRRSDPGAAALSACWLANGKALIQQALAERTLLTRDHPDPATAQAVGELLAVRQRLAELSLGGARPGQEKEHRRHLAGLRTRERELTRSLGQAHFRSLVEDPWVELARVRQALPGDAVLIDVARITVYDFQARGNQPRRPPARYVAWIIPPEGRAAVQVIDLGPAAKIEAAVGALALDRGDLGGTREARAEEAYRRRLTAVAELVLRPLARYIDHARQWLISPDASLWLVPWAALPLADGRYAIERHTLSYVISGRDLVAARPDAPRTPPLVFADPDFDLKARDGGNASPLVRGLPSGRQLPRFERLPGTAAEARALGPLLRRYASSEPVVHTGVQALEGTFKAARRPRLLVLSTHGFFLEDQGDAAAPLAGGRGDRGLALVPRQKPSPTGGGVRVYENPLLRCGLALAGANRREEVLTGAEDGILTGLEIVGTDLRGCELVVLSACETGRGQVNVGEGVAGLRQAFQLAGARSVVATLWQIPDRETTQLMTAFFTHLAAGKGKAEALRRAQLEIIKHRRHKQKAAHPFFWAAFTLTGDWR
jgi:CHAT domain-containing protein/tetratricopeptide (TPR) repeat protein